MNVKAIRDIFTAVRALAEVEGYPAFDRKNIRSMIQNVYTIVRIVDRCVS